MINLSIAIAEEISIETIIAAAEEKYNIPTKLLASIAEVESGISAYRLNARDKPMKFNTREETAVKVKELIKSGVSNIDIGVMQLNWRWHGKKFLTIEQMLDPKVNIEYGAKFLSRLYQKHKCWHKAIRHYHSANVKYYKDYSRKVVLAWLRG